MYCSDLDSLRDLWAMCDRINTALRSVILPKRHPLATPVLVEFGLYRASTRVSISGPQLMRYKQHLVDMRLQQELEQQLLLEQQQQEQQEEQQHSETSLEQQQPPQPSDASDDVDTEHVDNDLIDNDLVPVTSRC